MRRIGRSRWRHLDEVMQEWRSTLETIANEKFESPVNAEYQAPWRSPLRSKTFITPIISGRYCCLENYREAGTRQKGFRDAFI